jgi:hypothetical protein
MNDVFVERQWEVPVTQEMLQQFMATAAGCLRIHRVQWLGTCLSTDGKDMFCHFRGPDAESVRIAIAQSGGAPASRSWPCTVLDAPEATPGDLEKANVLIGHSFDEPAQFGAREIRDDVDMGCFHLHRVRLLRSYLSADRRRMFTVYLAPDAESARLAQRESGLPSDRIWPVRRYAP